MLCSPKFTHVCAEEGNSTPHVTLVIAGFPLIFASGAGYVWVIYDILGCSVFGGFGRFFSGRWGYNRVFG